MKLKEKYNTKVLSELQKDLNINNCLAVPKLLKACINIGLGEAKGNSKIIDSIKEEISLICGQTPHLRKAKKAIAGFKIRAGQDVALSVTLRNQKMYDFIEKLINLVLPRIRDFRGLNNSSFDQHGNYSLGFKEQIIFPEIKFDDVSYTHGIQITINSSAKNPEQALKLLTLLGFPFKKKLGAKNG